MHTTPIHPLATHSALDVLGYRRNGAPIYAIAGGADDGAPESGQDGQPDTGGTPPPESAPSDQGGQPSGQDPDTGGEDVTDWKAHAREWEKRAKANAKAQKELEQLREAQMTEQEKAVEAAKAEGRTAAASEYGAKLAAAEFRAAVAAAGLDLGEAAEYIDVTRFVGDDGEVNTTAIKSAVTKFSKLAPRGPGRSGADISGGSGDQPTLDAQIADAQKRGAWREVLRLQNSKLTNQ